MISFDTFVSNKNFSENSVISHKLKYYIDAIKLNMADKPSVAKRKQSQKYLDNYRLYKKMSDDLSIPSGKRREYKQLAYDNINALKWENGLDDLDIPEERKVSFKSFEEFKINEKWVASIVKRGVDCPIYENPSSKDLIDLKKSGLRDNVVRFAAILSNKKIYVWAGMEIIHDDALAKLTKEKIIPATEHDNLDNALCGTCNLIDGRLSFALNDGMDSYFGPAFHGIKRNFDSSFLPLPYFENKDLIADLPKIIERYKWVGKFIDEYETKSSPALLLQYSKTL